MTYLYSIHFVTGTITKFTFESMFWMTNLVANRAYMQWFVVAPIIQVSVLGLFMAQLTYINNTFELSTYNTFSIFNFRQS